MANRIAVCADGVHPAAPFLPRTVSNIVAGWARISPSDKRRGGSRCGHPVDSHCVPDGRLAQSIISISGISDEQNVAQVGLRLSHLHAILHDPRDRGLFDVVTDCDPARRRDLTTVAELTQTIRLLQSCASSLPETRRFSVRDGGGVRLQPEDHPAGSHGPSQHRLLTRRKRRPAWP